ncbi:uncharacterized protein LOC135470636 [Liolophura sinensis]|uniref:uncharacterized protein LOC135470636 n=1 Tax=Liolophura sinensis TaxID=3198878 RepID=UPI0031595F7C
MATCMMDSECRDAVMCINPCGSNQTCVFICLSSYADAKFDAFMKCAVTDNQCVVLTPPDHPVQCRKPTSVFTSFTLADIQGPWYIVKGKNPIYDCFDCQISTYTSGSLPYRGSVREQYDARTVNGSVRRLEVTETVIQRNPMNGGVLNFNSTQDGLDHQEEFRVLDYSQNHGYIFMYYCGGTGAWMYEGAILYSRTPQLTPEAMQQVTSSAAAHGYSFGDFCSPRTSDCISK